MSRRIECLDCGARLSVAEDFAGKRVKCPKCQAAILLPTGPAPLLEDELYDVVPDARRKRRKGRKDYPWTQTAGVSGLVALLVLMMLAGFKTLLPAAGLGLVGLWALTSLRGRARCYAAGLAACGSIVVWLAWSMVANRSAGGIVLIVPAVAAMAWLAQRPGLIPALVLSVLIGLIAALLLAASAGEAEANESPRSAMVILALAAIAAVWGGWYEERWRYEGVPA